MLTAPVFDLQRFSVHDGPGVRTTVFLKGCPLRCAWCHNPESHRATPELLFSADRCAGCARCLPACPTQAIRVDGRRVTDRSRCDGCGRCVAVCLREACAICGAPRGVDEVLGEVLRDRDYFGETGGLTVSGGEPLQHPGFVAALLEAACAQGVHTCVQTCGQVPWAAFEAVLPHARLFQLDLKHLDSARHAVLTGVGNELILANARRLVARGAKVELRMPVIPGVNDDSANLVATATLVRELGQHAVQLVPYHGWYAAKDRALGRPERVVTPAREAQARLEQVRQWFTAQDLAVEVDG